MCSTIFFDIRGYFHNFEISASGYPELIDCIVFVTSIGIV